MPTVSVIVPTFNEAGNAAALLARLDQSLQGFGAEVIFVDDGSDDLPEVVSAAVSTLSVHVIRRSTPTGGLSGAVIEGFRHAEGDLLVCLDGDLQHPPEMIPALLETLADDDLAIASRYCGNGNAGGLDSGIRRAVSSSSTLLSRLLFPRRVGRKCTDPMTGFFCVRRSAVDLDRLKPRGFKILLEILASHDLRVAEMPFVFGERLAGVSKASWRNGLAFLQQLFALRVPRTMRFAGVGMLGVVVNLLVMTGLLHLDVGYVVASVIATEVAIVHNFLLQERLVFHDLRDGSAHAYRHRAWRSILYNNVDNAVRIPILIELVDNLHIHAVLAQAMTLVVSFGARFFYTSRVVYRPRPELVVPTQHVSLEPATQEGLTV